jgi:acyl carrier protein
MFNIGSIDGVAILASTDDENKANELANLIATLGSEPEKPVVTNANTQAIEKKVLRIIRDFIGHDRKTILPETKFFEDLGWDSLDCVEILMNLEDEFEVCITDEECENWTTVNDVIKGINEINSRGHFKVNLD